MAARAICLDSARGRSARTGWSRRTPRHRRTRPSLPAFRLMGPDSRPTGRSIRCRIPTSTTRSCGRPRCPRRPTPTPRAKPARHRFRGHPDRHSDGRAFYYAGDPGLRNPTIYIAVSDWKITPARWPRSPRRPFHPWGTSCDPVYRISDPALRVIPGSRCATRAGTHQRWTPASTIDSGPSNAGETGNPSINNLIPVLNRLHDDGLALHRRRGRATDHLSQCGQYGRQAYGPTKT